MTFANVHVADHREVKADVSGEAWLDTPAGKRPIQAARITVLYALRSGHIYIEVHGRKRFGHNTNNLRVNDSLTRRFTGRDLAHLPEWVREFVEQHLPKRTPEREGGWRL